MLKTHLVGALGAGLFALAAATSAQAATITVNDPGNSGPGTLRDAINSANNRPKADTIEFHMGAGLHTITPTTPLPAITAPVTLDGYTGSATPASANGPADLRVTLDAVNLDDGLVIESDGVTVRGLNIQHARREGVHVEGNGNTIAGNYIGTDVGGLTAEGNDLEGVRVFGDDNQIGGPNPEDRNVIAASGFAEVLVDEGTGNAVQNNLIGTNRTGTRALGDHTGVDLESPGNTVRDNVISGESSGVQISSDDNVVQGNKVGTNASGSAALPNTVGIEIFGGDRNQIGGTADEDGNVVSGNEHSGVQLSPLGDDPAAHNNIEGNRIGTTAAGDAPLPNGGGSGTVGTRAGVAVSGSDDNTIGAGNVISANAGPGIDLADATGNEIVGNAIGTDAGGALDLGNDGPGVDIDGENNRVGDTDASAANTIAHNHGDGVTVESGSGNAVLRGSIHDNHELAIDLNADDETPNDDAQHDADPGPNDLQNGPEIDSATATDVTWSLESEPTTRYRLEFYANDACSHASVTEAQTYLGSTVITTDANGHQDDTTPITLPAGAGSNLSMTATRIERVLTGIFPPTFALVPRSTSEVSPCETI
jgi:parallel beta-helix repeat protein